MTVYRNHTVFIEQERAWSIAAISFSDPQIMTGNT